MSACRRQCVHLKREACALNPIEGAGLQSIAVVRADVTDYNAEILSKIVTLHNNTVDQVNSRIDQYLPQVRKYDHM